MSDVPKLKATNLELKKAGGGPDNVKAYGKIVFNDTLCINGIRIMTNKKGELFVSWPARQLTGKWIPYVSFTEEKSELRNKLSDWIIKQYKDGNVQEAKSSQSTNTSETSKNDDDDEDLPF